MKLQQRSNINVNELNEMNYKYTRKAFWASVGIMLLMLYLLIQTAVQADGQVFSLQLLLHFLVFAVSFVIAIHLLIQHVKAISILNVTTMKTAYDLLHAANDPDAKNRNVPQGTYAISDLTHLLDSRADGELQVEHATERLIEVIENWDIPMQLKRTLQWNWFNHRLEAEQTIDSVEEITESDYLEEFMQHELLPIGSCANGDMVVIDYRNENFPVSFITLAEYLGSDRTDPKEFSAKVSDSLVDYFIRIADGLFIPYDYYSAKDVNR
jgi:hypothetical protein